MGRVFVLGISPLLIPKLPPAEVLVGSANHLELYPDFQGEKLLLKPPFTPLFNSVEEVIVRGDAVILATGDPLFYGIAQAVVKRFGPAVVEVVPNVSHMQLAFSRMGVSWQDAGFLSLHGRGMDGLLRAFTLAEHYLFLFTDPSNNPSAVARHLLDAGVEGVKMWIFSRLGEDDEEVLVLSADQATTATFREPNCVVLEKVKPGKACHFPPDSSFRTAPGLLTKGPLRAMVLSLVSPSPDSVVWDVGSGSGAVAISLSPLVNRVYAVESDPKHLEILRTNRRIHGAWNVIPVAGEAPKVLEGIPVPDRVFVGTGGERLGEILEECWRRLTPGGILVATVVTLRGKRSLLEWGKGEIISLELARGSVMEEPGFLVPSKPVWVLKAVKDGV